MSVAASTRRLLPGRLCCLLLLTAATASLVLLRWRPGQSTFVRQAWSQTGEILNGHLDKPSASQWHGASNLHRVDLGVASELELRQWERGLEPSTETRLEAACGHSDKWQLAVTFVHEDARRLRLRHAKPPLLFSFPGSGNTW